jgi:hypothetical protein
MNNIFTMRAASGFVINYKNNYIDSLNLVVFIFLYKENLIVIKSAI